MRIERRTSCTTSINMLPQEQLTRVAPLIGAALLQGAGGGFALATKLSLTTALHLPPGARWVAIAQAYGHVQLYGWVGVFVLGVAFHVLPRLRSATPAFSSLLPWILGFLVCGVLLRALSQPLLVATGAGIFSLLLVGSGLLEWTALIGAVALLVMAVRDSPELAARPACIAVFPFFALAFSGLAAASCVNLVNMLVAATTGGLVPGRNDDLNVMLGLFGFLVPVALVVSSQALPLVFGREAFPRRLLWPFAGIYLAGLLLTDIGIGAGSQQASWPGMLEGLGMLLLGSVLLGCISSFLLFMRKRGRLPQRVPSPQATARPSQKNVIRERKEFGPWVALVASAYLWAILGGILLAIDGIAMLSGSAPVFAIDALRQSLSIGFIALFIGGIAPRMLPGCSGGTMASPYFVRATLWLGNTATLLLVGSMLLAPIFASLTVAGVSLSSLLVGVSGPLGLAFAFCLLVNLWPALRPASPPRR